MNLSDLGDTMVQLVNHTSHTESSAITATELDNTTTNVSIIGIDAQP